MPSTTIRFMERRIRAVAMDARIKPETCRAARQWLHLAVEWALQHGSPYLAMLALDEEQAILC